MLETPSDVIRALITYTDWWQPVTGSVLQTRRRRTARTDGIRDGLLETLDVRSELCRRMQDLSDRDRRLLCLWYLRDLQVEEISRALRVSRRQCFRLRSAAIRAIADPDEAGAPTAA